MLEDRSTNGTIVNAKLLRAHKDASRILQNGTTVEVLSHADSNDLKFIVRLPKRDGVHALAWNQNFKEYMNRLDALRAHANATITPGPQGPVGIPQPYMHYSYADIPQIDLFPPELQVRRPQRNISYEVPSERTQDGSDRIASDWTDSERYHRVCKIGQGAFATVYKVTHKYSGVPYAAKELDKRKFMKNGVLDQKVENELNIMQRIKHVSIPYSDLATISR